MINRTNYRFHIDNKRGKFILQIALDFGNRGGPSSADYIDISKSAYADIGPFTVWEFDYEPQAQAALFDFKVWLGKYTKNWYRSRTPNLDKYPKYQKALKDVGTCSCCRIS